MQEQDFDALVARLEVYERQSPGPYRLRLALLAALGHIYLVALIAVLLAIVILILVAVRFNFLILKVLWIPLAIVGVILRSLWVRLPEPDGHEIYRQDAPRLFDLIDEVKDAVNGPRLSHVLVSDVFNAGIIQLSRLGLFGWSKNYLTIGLPLMHALTPAEFKAILAHEFGHLSSRHGYFSTWIYRVRQTWVQIMTTMDLEKRYGSELFRRFLDWYAPYLNAYSLVLARRQEYEADQFAVELSGQKDFARALINMDLKERQLDQEFWPRFYRDADQQSRPPKEPLTQLLSSLRQPIADNTIAKWFTESLSTKTESSDTHPCLADRLAALGYDRDLEGNSYLSAGLPISDPDAGDAAGFYLDALPETYLSSRNRWWREAVEGGWRERHEFVQEARTKLEQLEHRSKTVPLTIEERWEAARLTMATQGAPAAVPLLQDVIATEPEHAGANYSLGEALLDREDQNGIAHIERAIAQDPRAEVSGCQLIYAFLHGRGNLDEAEHYLVRAKQAYQKMEKADQEREAVSKDDEFTTHDLDGTTVAELSDQLLRLAQLRQAYLVRKVVHYFPEEPFYVLGVIPRRPWYKGRSESDERSLLDSLGNNLQFPGRLLIVVLEGNWRSLRKPFQAVPESAIF